MHLTRKQTILIVTLSGVAALLLVGLLLLLHYGKSDPIPAEPSLPAATETPAPTEPPTPTPEPTATPSPTPYYLPLVPEGAANPPTPLPPAPTATPAPEAKLKSVPSPRDGIYNDEIREFMAIGTQNGEAVAVLLVRVKPPDAIVVAIPCETQAKVYTLKKGAVVSQADDAPISCATVRTENKREGCWNLVWAVKNLTGYRAQAYLCVDFACMDAFFSFAPSLPADGGDVDLAAFSDMLRETGEARAASMAQLGVGAVRFLSKVSLWDLPSFRSATRGAFTSSLSVLELLSLMRDLKKVDSFSVFVLPTEWKDGVRVLSDAAKLPF
ncbi:MAG: hypothetical protein IJI34_00825 [Clostridia bacterium]|nr:hypothetical protein [Clostridia bacterium]